MLELVTPGRIYTAGFAIAIISVLLGSLMYLIDIWAEGWIPKETLRKFYQTGGVLIVTSLVVSVIAFIWTWFRQ